MSHHDVYDNPLVGRYASAEMSRLFSPRHRIRTWRRIWLTLAEAEAELGVPITARQLARLRRTIDDIDFDAAAAHEKRLRHDVMAHVHAWGDVAPEARGILHLGATSMDIVDNADLLIARDALGLIRDWLVTVIDALATFARRHRGLPCLGYTHFQPAQLTTVGRRACLWAYDFVRDLEEIEYRLANLRFRGIRGATGTQASFLALFDGDARKVARLEKLVAGRQTYTRKIDYFVLALLAGIAHSAYKMAGDIRLLANLREIEEPFGKKQIGSSAMAYKRNPMRSERVCSLARYVMDLPVNAAHTHATQWFERTLDDSANRRLILPEAFLGIDVILSLLVNITDGLQVWPEVIAHRVAFELPFMATENILMEAVKSGGNRQELHEAIRVHSMEAARRIKTEGADNDLLGRIKADPAFAAIAGCIDDLVDPVKFVGRAPQQTEEYIREHIAPILALYDYELSGASVDSVNV